MLLHASIVAIWTEGLLKYVQTLLNRDCYLDQEHICVCLHRRAYSFTQLICFAAVTHSLQQAQCKSHYTA